MKKPGLRPFYAYFAQTVACVRIYAVSAKEAQAIAQDNYDRGELTAENAGLRLLPEGRSIEYYYVEPNPPYIASVKEDE